MLLLLIRHAVTGETGKRLYGRTPGVHLSDEGRHQAARLAGRLGAVPLHAVYSSPLERATETAEALVRGRRLRVRTLAGVLETDMGSWSGRSFPAVRATKLWRRLHETPSAYRFPRGESALETQARMIAAIEEVAGRHPKGTVAIVSHADPIRLALAHYLGMHIDLFRRLEVAPASVSAAWVGDGTPRVMRVNATGTLDDLGPARKR